MVINVSVSGEKNLKKTIENIGDLEINPHELVEKYKPIAKNKAPVADDRLGGGTRDAIITVKPKEKQGILRLYQPQKRFPKVPYHLYMHGLGAYNTIDKIKNGKGNFMNEVGKMIVKDIKNQIRNKTNNLK